MKVFDKLPVAIFILLTLFAFCTQLKINQDKIIHTRKFSNLYEAKHTPYPLQNFIYLDSYVVVTDPDGEIVSEDTINSASGIAVKGSRGKVHAFTAAHWCNVDNSVYEAILNPLKNINPEIKIEIQKRVGFFGRYYKIEEIFSDDENDVCVVTFSSPYAYKVKNISPSKNYPDIGEKVYTSSAPHGIFSHSIRLIFDGYFGGCQENTIYCYYTIPGVDGSSGSGVLNSKGEIISILDVSVINFYEVTGGAKLEAITEMYELYIEN